MNSMEVSRAVMATDPQVFREALAYLARCQAEYQRLADVVSTKDPDSLRSALDEVARMRYERDGIKSYDVKVGESKVGTYTVRASKEEPERTEKRTSIDIEAAREWLGEVEWDFISAFIEEHIEDFISEYTFKTGEVLPFVRTVEEHVPATPSMFKNMVLKVDAEKVGKALREAEAKQIEGTVA